MVGEVSTTRGTDGGALYPAPPAHLEPSGISIFLSLWFLLIYGLRGICVEGGMCVHRCDHHTSEQGGMST